MKIVKNLKYTSVYKAPNPELQMNKNQLEQRHRVKGCYGTPEWSDKSGICCGCGWKEDCGKIRKIREEIQI